MNDWKSILQSEFDRAEQARAKGNEGQARVCARRAAGVAIREYLGRRGIPIPSTSAVDLLNFLKDDPHLSTDLRSIIEHLTLRVTEEFKLPIDADLIAESKKLCAELLSEHKDPKGH